MINVPFLAITCSALLLLLLHSSTEVGAQFAGCDYSESLRIGDTREIFSPNYPSLYRGQVNCRWSATAPVGTTLQLECTDVYLPSSLNCANDRILVSREGRPALAGALAFCGTQRFTVESTGNRIVVALRTPARSAGGRFLCRLTVLQPCYCGVRNWGRQTFANNGTVTRIVGGVETGVNEFPMMAGVINLRGRDVICGATIISNRHALTAAHCLINQSPTTVALLVGDHDLATGVDTPYAAIYTLTRLLSHAGFNVATSANDIAILTTASAMAFNYGVGPACLPFAFTGNTFAGHSVEATGWGTTSFGGQRVQRLRRVSLDVITNAVCRRSFPSLLGMNICTYSEGRDMCQFDSGGPLLWTNSRNGLLYLVGISSYGLYCAGSEPGVSTRVASYLSWVQQNAAGTQFCRPVA